MLVAIRRGLRGAAGRRFVKQRLEKHPQSAAIAVNGHLFLPSYGR
jgi:hypothetical protein